MPKKIAKVLNVIDTPEAIDVRVGIFEESEGRYVLADSFRHSFTKSNYLTSEKEVDYKRIENELRKVMKERIRQIEKKKALHPLIDIVEEEG